MPGDPVSSVRSVVSSWFSRRTGG